MLALHIISIPHNKCKWASLQVKLRGCSYENSFPIVLPLNWENIFFFLAFMCEIFPWLSETDLGGLLDGNIFQETKLKNGWHKHEETFLSSAVCDHIWAWYSHFIRNIRNDKYSYNTHLFPLNNGQHEGKKDYEVNTFETWIICFDFSQR